MRKGVRVLEVVGKGVVEGEGDDREELWGAEEGGGGYRRWRKG